MVDAQCHLAESPAILHVQCFPSAFASLSTHVLHCSKHCCRRSSHCCNTPDIRLVSAPRTQSHGCCGRTAVASYQLAMRDCAASPAACISNRRPAAASAGCGLGLGLAAASLPLLLSLWRTQLCPEPKQMSRKMMRMTMMTATPITSFIFRLFHHILRRNARPLFTKRSACGTDERWCHLVSQYVDGMCDLRTCLHGMPSTGSASCGRGGPQLWPGCRVMALLLLPPYEAQLLALQDNTSQLQEGLRIPLS